MVERLRCLYPGSESEALLQQCHPSICVWRRTSGAHWHCVGTLEQTENTTHRLAQLSLSLAPPPSISTHLFAGVLGETSVQDIRHDSGVHRAARETLSHHSLEKRPRTPR